MDIPRAGDYIGQMALALAVVLALIFGAAWLLRRMAWHPAKGQALRVVSALSIGRNEKVLLIEAGDRQLLIGATDSRISTLYVFEEPIAPREPDAEGGEKRMRARDAFARMLKNAGSAEKTKEGDDDKTAS